MDTQFRMFPEQASTGAPQVDQLYMFLLGIAFFFTFVICFLIIFFAIRYRRGAKVDRTRAVDTHYGLEVVWGIMLLVIVMICFGWGAAIYIDNYQPPEDVLDIFVVGKQWMWKIQHPEGRREVNELHVPVGQPVRLTMVSEDVIHSFYLPAFRIKQDVLPGRYTRMWFQPTRPGVYHLFCAEYCGTSHSLMRGQIVAMEQEQYANWLAEEEIESAAEAGERTFEQLRCQQCHQEQSTPKGPSLVGLFGQQVTLADGRTVTADFQYLRRAILNPAADVRPGYEAVMPSYEGQVSEEQILHLIAYIKTLSQP